MNNQIAIEAIQSCKDFDGLGPTEKDTLAVIGEVLGYKRGDIIFSMDQIGNHYFYLVYSGALVLKLKSRRKALKTLKEGDLFGEIAFFSDEYRLGTIECKEDTTLVAFDREKVLNPVWVAPSISLHVCIALTKKIASYFYQDINASTIELVAKGEGKNIEFKRDLNDNKKKIVETITAFMNFDGGTILIGVEDDGTIVGIPLPEDRHERNIKRDEYVRKLIDATKFRIDKHWLDLIRIDWDKVNEKYIMRVDCEQADYPVFYKENSNDKENEYYFIRVEAENIKLSKTSEIVPHIFKRMGVR